VLNFLASLQAIRRSVRSSLVASALFATLEHTHAQTAVESELRQQDWAVHVQGTEIAQGQPGFDSPYQGAYSLPPEDNFRQTSSFDLYFGARLWPSGELYVNGEYYQGFGLGTTHGIAAFPSAEAYKVGQKIGDVFFPHIIIRETIGLGGEQEDLAPDQLQLGEKQDVSRLTFTIGRMAVTDQFDGNIYAHDQRHQFINWVLVDSGAFDYAADSLGYIEGATFELNQRSWALRYGVFDVPRESNGFAKDQHFAKAWQQVVEFQLRVSVNDHPGNIRLLGWVEHAHMGSYSETLAQPDLMEDITLTRRYRFQGGVSLSADQELTKEVGVFLRASWRDGKSEVWQFTDIDRNIAAGVQIKGSSWKRLNDTIGIGEVLSGLSQSHREYLAAGGLSILIGDGKLPHYGLENVLEAYYDAEVVKSVHLMFDYQFVANPGYNQDRGPVHIFSARFHFQL